MKRGKNKMKDLQSNNEFYKKIEEFLRRYFRDNTNKLLINVSNYYEIKFVDLLENSDYIYPNDKDLSLKLGIYGNVSVSSNIEDKFIITYATGNYSRILFGNPERYWVNYFKRRIRVISKHESYHVRQFIWVLENTSDWEGSLRLIQNYDKKISHNNREYEIEANKASISYPNLKPFKNYLSRFII